MLTFLMGAACASPKIPCQLQRSSGGVRAKATLGVLAVELGENRSGLPRRDHFVQRILLDARDSAQDRQCGFGVSDVAPPSHLEERVKGIGAKFFEQLRLTRRRERDEDQRGLVVIQPRSGSQEPNEWLRRNSASQDRLCGCQNLQRPYGVVANAVIRVEAGLDQGVDLPVELAPVPQHLRSDGAMVGV